MWILLILFLLNLLKNIIENIIVTWNDIDDNKNTYYFCNHVENNDNNNYPLIDDKNDNNNNNCQFKEKDTKTIKDNTNHHNLCNNGNLTNDCNICNLTNNKNPYIKNLFFLHFEEHHHSWNRIGSYDENLCFRDDSILLDIFHDQIDANIDNFLLNILN